MGALDGKVALVTGASMGIGEATARLLVRQGARVAVVARREAESQQVVSGIRAEGGDAVFVRADVADPAQVDRMVEAVVAWGGALDIAVNNAAKQTEFLPIAETQLDAWAGVMATNLTGLFLCMKAEIRAMRAAGGAIVNVLSGLALAPLPMQGPYVASKYGALGLTHVAAIEEAANGIRINAVCPGATRTAMLRLLEEARPEVFQGVVAQHPIGRVSTPEEQAKVIAFLCGPDASFMIGSTVQVDGGWVLT